MRKAQVFTAAPLWAVVLLSTAALLSACEGERDAAADLGQTDAGADAGADLAMPDAVADLAGTDVAITDLAGTDVAITDLAAPDARPPFSGAPACDPSVHVGRFLIALADGYTAVQGQVMNGVEPLRVPRLVASAGPCELVLPPVLDCDPTCAVGTTCGPDGLCLLVPLAVDVGEVTVEGLTAPVTMSGRPPVFFYTFRGALPHPGFDEGDALTLRAQGLSELPGFELRGVGVAPLLLEGESLAIGAARVPVLEWQPPTIETPARIFIELSIANHGGTPARLVCEVPDTGRFELPTALVDALLAYGATGFPSVSVSRATVDQVTLAGGCIELRVQSSAALPVDIPGLISCSEDLDCPAPQRCRADLTCGLTCEEIP
ncbi:MAG: hypothetical protein EXR76_14335 [Myxococcales bacterium]|nr:hypothetical protein [Myxococcales bacterium]